MIPDAFAAAMLLALLLDAVVGWPDQLFQRIGHPVTWIGRMISAWEKDWNTGEAKQRRTAGKFVAGSVIAVTVAVAWIVTELLPGRMVGRCPDGHSRLALGGRAVAL